MFKFAKENKHKIIIIGVGGGGGNAVNNMIDSNLKGVHFVAANTDLYSLQGSLADRKIQLGSKLTKGYGAGANPTIGEEAAFESITEIMEVVKGADIIFIVVGLGGGTGTGAAPVIANICKRTGALTLAVVTKPFYFEGGTRVKNAKKGWMALKKSVDAIITVPNDYLIPLADDDIRFIDSMRLADEISVKVVRSISDLVSTTGYINLDLADVCTVMRGIGVTFVGLGEAAGTDRGLEAVNSALGCPFLKGLDLAESKKALVNITTSRESFTLSEFYEISDRIKQVMHEDVLMIIGVVFDDTVEETLSVTVLTSGYFFEE